MFHVICNQDEFKGEGMGPNKSVIDTDRHAALNE